MPYQKINKLIEKYANIRREFEDTKNNEKYGKYLSGNDNYVGIIGEYWARRFLESKGKNVNAVTQVNNKTKRNKSSKWVDFIIDDNEYISVKAITNENQNKESGIIYNPKREDQNIIYSALIIKLNDDLQPEKILYINDLDNNLIDGDCKNCKKYKYNWENKGKISFKFYIKNKNFDLILKDFIYNYNIK